MNIGQKIKERREFLGLTQEELAKKLGYAGRSSVNKVENSREVSMKKIKEYANALETTVPFLMGWENAEEEEKTETPVFEKEHIELITLYSQLEKEQKEAVFNLLRSFCSSK